MRDDDLLKDVFRRATHGEPRVGDAFARFERHERRAALVRFLTVAAVALAAAVLLTRLLPGVSFGDDPEVQIPGGQDLSEPTASNRYVDPILRFELLYPLDWIGRGSPGRPAQFYPRVGLEQTRLTAVKQTRRECGSACGAFGSRYVSESPEQFFIEVRALSPDCRDPWPGCAWLTDQSGFLRELRRAGADVVRVKDTVAGRSATVFDTAFGSEPKLVRNGGTRLPPHYWCASCRAREYLVPWPTGSVLYLRIVTNDVTDFERYNEAMGFVVEQLAVAGQARR